MKDILKLTPKEAESMGIEQEKEKEETTASTEVQELPMHEQVVGELTEGEVVEALTGEVTTESVEDVEEAIGDLQEDVAEEEGT